MTLSLKLWKDKICKVYIFTLLKIHLGAWSGFLCWPERGLDPRVGGLATICINYQLQCSKKCSSQWVSQRSSSRGSSFPRDLAVDVWPQLSFSLSLIQFPCPSNQGARPNNDICFYGVFTTSWGLVKAAACINLISCSKKIRWAQHDDWAHFTDEEMKLETSPLAWVHKAQIWQNPTWPPGGLAPNPRFFLPNCLLGNRQAFREIERIVRWSPTLPSSGLTI